MAWYEPFLQVGGGALAIKALDMGIEMWRGSATTRIKKLETASSDAEKFQATLVARVETQGKRIRELEEDKELLILARNSVREERLADKEAAAVAIRKVREDWASEIDKVKAQHAENFDNVNSQMSHLRGELLRCMARLGVYEPKRRNDPPNADYRLRRAAMKPSEDTPPPPDTATEDEEQP